MSTATGCDAESHGALDWSPIKFNVFGIGVSTKNSAQQAQPALTNSEREWLKPQFSVSKVVPVRPTDLIKTETVRQSRSVSVTEELGVSDNLIKHYKRHRSLETHNGLSTLHSDTDERKRTQSCALTFPLTKGLSFKTTRANKLQEQIDSPSIQFELNTQKADKDKFAANNNISEGKLVGDNREISNGFEPIDNEGYLSSQCRDEKKQHHIETKDFIEDYEFSGKETVAFSVSSKETQQRKWSLDAKMSVTNSSRRFDATDGNANYTSGSSKGDKNSPAQSPGRGGRKQLGPGSFPASTTSMSYPGNGLSKRRDSKDGLLKRADSKGEISPMSLRIRRRANSVDPTWQLRAAQELRSRSPKLQDLKSEEAPTTGDEQKRRTSSVDRIMRDYRLTGKEVKALRCILEKVNLYDDDTRNALQPLLRGSFRTITEDSEDDDVEKLSDTIIKDAEKESLKQKLFLSRKELDSYISFTRKMEKEKRQIMSEKEELRTRVQWLDKRLSLMESESKALKIERAEFLNQIYRLRCPANVPINERGNSSRLSMAVDSPDDVEVSKQRLKYEADAFAAERAKMIKERQRLDEEVRKVQIRCVSLLAQLQHAEKTIDDLRVEKEALKSKLGKSSQQLSDDTRTLQDQLKQFKACLLEGKTLEGLTKSEDVEKRLISLFDFVKETQGTKSELEKQSLNLEEQLEEARREIRELREEKLQLDTENMALRTDLEGVTNARNEAELKLNDLDSTSRQTLSENKALSDTLLRYQEEHVKAVEEIDKLSNKITEMQQEGVSMEHDRNAFENFLEMLSIELEEKLGEDHVTQDSEAANLKEKAEIVGRQIRAHLAPARKLQDDYEDIKEELEDLRKENDALKYAMSCRVQIANIQQQPVQCDCSREKENLERELDDMASRIELLENEVTRLHQDKQSLLMSLMNLQAAARSREPSNADATDASEADEYEVEESSEDEDVGNGNVSSEEADMPRVFSPGIPLEVILKYDDRDSGADKTQSDDETCTKKKLGKALSLPPALSRPARSAEDLVEYSRQEDGNQNLEKQLKEMTKTKEKLEEERVSMLDSLIRQVEQVEELKAEVERLQQELEDYQQNDSFASQGQTCSQCAKFSTEIRHYLTIIEELTEDKLRLEKLLGDVRRDKEKLIRDLEEGADEKFVLQQALDKAKKDKEDAILTAREEVDYLMQSIENFQQDNTSLEEHLQRIRQDKAELLNTLKAAEEDKLRLIRSLQVLSDAQEDHLQPASHPQEIMKCNNTTQTGTDFNQGGTSVSSHNVCSEPAEIPKPIDENSNKRVPENASLQLHLKVEELEDSVTQYQMENAELRRTIETLTALLMKQREKVTSSDGFEPQTEMTLPKIVLNEEADDEEDSNEHNSGENDGQGYDRGTEQEINPSQEIQSTHLSIREAPSYVSTDERILYPGSAESSGDVKSKTLCFQISFNGIALADTGKISMFK